jgi:Type II restriction endonuclease EcoO109I
MPLTSDQRERIARIFARFLERRVKNLLALRLEDLKFNVVALRVSAEMLEFTTPLELMRYRLAQHLERGAVTAMGSALQQVAREIAGSGSGVAGADIEVTDAEGRRYFVQVKSGPDTANKDIAQNIGTLLNSARARDPTAICVLGVCYARPEQISAIAKAELVSRGVALKVGREFWEFVSGDPGCLDELLELAGEGASGGASGGARFADLVDAKARELAAAFEARYGSDLADAETWAAFLAENS